MGHKKKHSARNPAFSRILSSLKRVSKRWYKGYIHRRNRRNLHQAIDIEDHVDRPCNSWDLD